MADGAFEVVAEEGRQFQVLYSPVRPVDAEAALVEVVADEIGAGVELRGDVFFEPLVVAV